MTSPLLITPQKKALGVYGLYSAFAVYNKTSKELEIELHILVSQNIVVKWERRIGNVNGKQEVFELDSFEEARTKAVRILTVHEQFLDRATVALDEPFIVELSGDTLTSEVCTKALQSARNAFKSTYGEISDVAWRYDGGAGTVNSTAPAVASDAFTTPMVNSDDVVSAISVAASKFASESRSQDTPF